MPVETRNRDGRLEVIQRGARRPWTRRAAGLLGFSLCLLPLSGIPEAGATGLPGLVVAQILLLVAAWKLLAEASRRGRTAASLHLATGEIEVTRGRGLLATTRPLGPVEVDRAVLARTGSPDRPAYDLLFVTRGGRPVRILVSETDEPAVRDAALVLSSGLGVELEDRRFPPPPRLTREGYPPAAVVRTGDEARRVYAWDYRDRFRPLLSLLALGTASALAVLFPWFADHLGILALAPAHVLSALGLGLAGHALTTLAVRRVTLRPDAVRFERHLAAIPLACRLTLYEELKAVLILGRGPFATVSLRTSSPGPGAAFPFEDPLIAGWLRNTIHRAAHDAGRRKTPLAG